MENLKFSEKHIESSLSLIKIGSIISMLMGFIYLLSFTADRGIPMPLSLAELPMLLISMFLLGLGVTLIVLGFIFLPAASKSKEFGVIFTVFSDNYISNIKVYMSLYAWPLLSFIAFLLLSVTTVSALTYWFLVFVVIVIDVFILYKATRMSGKISDDNTFIFVYLYFLLIVSLWMMIGLLFYIKVITSILPDRIIYFYIAIIVYAILTLSILFLMIMPSSIKNKDDKIKGSKNIYFWYVIAALIIVLPPVINPISVKLAEISLKIMGIGGGYQTIFFIDKKHIENIPYDVFNVNYSNRTVPLFVVLDVGKRVFVKLSKDDERVYALPSNAIVSKIYWKSKLTPEPNGWDDVFESD